jgi:5-methylthioadenosine/S-adenosylhomocysteine deaminase
VIEVHAADWVLPVAAPPLRDAAVAIVDDAIVAVGPREDVLALDGDARVEDHGAAAILPGFVNAHSHLEYASYGGFGDGLPFAPWIRDHMRRKAALSPEAMLDAATLGAVASLRSGVTTVADCSYAGATVRAAMDTGLRALVYLEAFGGPRAEAHAVATALARRLDEAEPEAGPLVRLGVSPHSPNTVAPHVYAAMLALADERGLPVATHVAESAAEIEALVQGTGPIVEAFGETLGVERLGEHPVARLARDRVLRPGTTAVHVVHVGEAEIATLAATGATVAHCPRSNAQLGCGIAPLRALRAAGVTVGLGSDSPSSAPDLDHFAELRAAVFAARAREADAAALSPAEALRLATTEAAAAVGLTGTTGALVPGLAADLCVVDLGATPYWPAEDPAAAVVYGGAPEHVALTVVAGAVRYRKSLDEPRYRAALARAAAGREAMIETSRSPV